MQMADGAAELQDAVVKLCCLWWQKELPGKADMVPQMIPYLLYQATVSGVQWEGCSYACDSELFSHVQQKFCGCLCSLRQQHVFAVEGSFTSWDMVKP